MNEGIISYYGWLEFQAITFVIFKTPYASPILNVVEQESYVTTMNNAARD